MDTKASVQKLLCILQSETNTKESKLAFEEFFNHFKEPLLLICIDICYKFECASYEEAADDLFQETIIKIYRNIKKFDKALYKNEKVLNAGLMAWMTRIAKNHFYQDNRKAIKTVSINELEDKKLKRKRVFDEDTVSQYQNENSVHSEENYVMNYRLNILEEEFSKLSDLKKDILRTAFYYSPYSIPSSELDRLENEYKITRDNIRKIKSRTINELRTILIDKIKVN